MLMSYKMTKVTCVTVCRWCQATFEWIIIIIYAIVLENGCLNATFSSLVPMTEMVYRPTCTSPKSSSEGVWILNGIAQCVMYSLTKWYVIIPCYQVYRFTLVLNHNRIDHNTKPKPMEYWCIATVAWTSCYTVWCHHFVGENRSSSQWANVLKDV